MKAANLHFTLRFLGDIPAESIGPLRDQLAVSTEKFGAFTICLSGLGGFPDLRRPRVIWIGADGELEKMNALAEKTEQGCHQAGFGSTDKPFSPHLTIGRVKKPMDLRNLTAALQSISFRSERFLVDHLVVYKSVLTPAGPIYTPLEKVRIT